MDMDEDYDWEIEEMERNTEEMERNTERADALGITLEELQAQQAAHYTAEMEKAWADAVRDIGLIQLYRKHMDLYVIWGLR